MTALCHGRVRPEAAYGKSSVPFCQFCADAQHPNSSVSLISFNSIMRTYSVITADTGAVIQQQTYLRYDNGAAVSVNGMFQFICYQVKAAVYRFFIILT